MIDINFLNSRKVSFWESLKDRFLDWVEHSPPPRIEAVCSGTAIAFSALSLLIAAPVPTCVVAAIALTFS